MTRHEKNLDNGTPLIEMRKMPTGGASDMTLKTDIREVSGLSDVLKLRPVTWQWATKGSCARREYGFVAQEVEKIFPQLVSLRTWDDGSDRKFLSTKEMIPLLVGALREQQDLINELRDTIDSVRR